MKKLNKIIAVAAFALSSIPAIAEQSVDEFCEEQSAAAESIMKARQSGASLSRMLAVGPQPSPYRQLIISAYELPRMQHPDNQKRMVVDFKNDHHLLCISTIEKLRSERSKKKSLM